MKYVAIIFFFPCLCSAATTSEWFVRDYFRNTPILAEIARCESGFIQFKDGQVIRGNVNPRDIGIMQINLDAHGKRAKDLGFDLYSTIGNLEYAKLLYQESGSAPWVYSQKCWKA